MPLYATPIRERAQHAFRDALAHPRFEAFGAVVGAVSGAIKPFPALGPMWSAALAGLIGYGALFALRFLSSLWSAPVALSQERFAELEHVYEQRVKFTQELESKLRKLERAPNDPALSSFAAEKLREYERSLDEQSKELQTCREMTMAESKRADTLVARVSEWELWGTEVAERYEILSRNHRTLAAAITDLGFKLGIIRVVAIGAPSVPTVQHPGKTAEESIEMAKPVILAANDAKVFPPELAPRPKGWAAE